MSFSQGPAPNGFPNSPQQGGGSLSDVISQLAFANQNMSLLITTLQAIFPRISGSFTMGAAATKVVTEPGVTANSLITLTATNPSAGTLMGSAKSLYISAKTPGASFTVATANAAAAVGTETMTYQIQNPV